MESKKLKKPVGEAFEKSVSDLLKKEKRDFLSVTNVKMRISLDILKALNLTRASDNSSFLKKVKPYLKGKLRCYRKKYSYIGFSLSDEKLIEDLIGRRKISVKKAAKILPISKRRFKESLNRMTDEGKICIVFDNGFDAFLKRESYDIEKDIKNFEKKCRKKFGQNFVRIHRLREDLKWEKDRFNKVIERLSSESKIQLLGGDPSEMNSAELENSFVDSKGRLRIMLTWRD